MPIQDLVYTSALSIARTAAPILGFGTSKLARALRGRSGAAERLGAWADSRDRNRPLAWFHGPSVGEGLQARAVLVELRTLRPELLAVFTHTSPSALGLAARMTADIADYLPWDGGPAFRRLMDRLAPDVIVFSQREVWPGVAREGAERGTPVVLAAATLPEDAARLRPAGRWFLGPTFARVGTILAISERDGARFQRLGVEAGRVAVTGDPGVDSAWERAAAADPNAPHLLPFRVDPHPTVVAGSTWPADEEVLVPAMTAVRGTVPGVRLVVAPHEPSPAHVDAATGALRAGGWDVRPLSAVVRNKTLAGANAVVVDSVGVLAELYTLGDAALVGGAFDRTGIHSVLEPAAAGLPVAFGPHHGGSIAAGDLLECGAARTARTPAELETILRGWLTDSEGRESAGAAGRAYMERHRGASRRSAERIAALLPP